MRKAAIVACVAAIVFSVGVLVAMAWAADAFLGAMATVGVGVVGLVALYDAQ